VVKATSGWIVQTAGGSVHTAQSIIVLEVANAFRSVLITFRPATTLADANVGWEATISIVEIQTKQFSPDLKITS
jgi:hypothetical protein